MASQVSLRIDGPDRGITIALAHGAGAPMDSDFMQAFALGLADKGYRAVRFEFPYMAQLRAAGQRRPPDREPILRSAWLQVIGQLQTERLWIGGKSMGGRIASLIADEAQVAGLICLGYPFHPTGKPQQLRIGHLQSLQTPTLIVQGERDPFGNKQEVAAYPLSPQIAIHWLADGDHSFKPRKSSGRTEQENCREALEAIDGFMTAHQ